MPFGEKESTLITCRVCDGTGRCSECHGWQEKKTCVQCYYSGRCLACGGSGKQAISRRL